MRTINPHSYFREAYPPFFGGGSGAIRKVVAFCDHTIQSANAQIRRALTLESGSVQEFCISGNWKSRP